MIRTYSEMLKYNTIEDRFRYLRLFGDVGKDTFGHSRYLNQDFYRSREWKRIRDEVIIRDNGCDLGVKGFDIYDRIYIHHMNPVSIEDLVEYDMDKLLNPETLVCVSFNTHQAIHYGDESLLPQGIIERRPGDTKLW